MDFLDRILPATGPLVWSSRDYTKTPLLSHRSTSCPVRWGHFSLECKNDGTCCSLSQELDPDSCKKCGTCGVCFALRVVFCHCWMTTRFICGNWSLGLQERWEGPRKRVWSLSKKWTITVFQEDLASRAAGTWDDLTSVVWKIKNFCSITFDL